MVKKLVKVIILASLLLIPNKISENKIDYENRPNYQNLKSKEKIIYHKDRIEEIEESLNILNIKKNFFLNRLKEENNFIERRNFYIENLKEINLKLKRYKSKKDSLVDLLKY